MKANRAWDHFEAAILKIASWRVKVAQLSNIEVWVHYSLGVVGLGLLAFPVYEFWKEWYEWKYDLFYLWIGSSLALAVLAHEIGHVVMAKVLGCGKAVLVFHALGGIAFLDRESLSTKPWRLLLVCASGPLTNLGLAGLAWWFKVDFGRDGRLLLEIFSEMNFILLINLLPIYPLDGGRIFKALLEIVGIPQKMALRTALCCSISGFLGLFLLWIVISEWFGVAELVILAPLLSWITWVDFKIEARAESQR